MTTHAAHSHAALERRDKWDALTSLAELVETVSKDAKDTAAKLNEARLVLAMADDVIRKGTWHPSHQNQVAGVRSQIRAVIK
ncbi:MAG: hypothetical protein CTY28_10320 [Hyphomicrobium sp.]|nr:MAG: hypothetical protein CTY28_10320 [Hyphomicrobium sp.]